MAFVHVDGNIEPDGAEAMWFDGREGVRLRALLAPPPSGRIRGTVILCHGRTEFIEKYFEVIRELQSRNFVVFSMDWRGQGLSGRMTANPQKGHLDSIDTAAADLAETVKTLGARLPRPHILLAHSMGGCIALRALQMRRMEVEGAVFSAPLWGLPNLKEFAIAAAKFLTAAGGGKLFAPGGVRRWRKERFKRNNVTTDRDRFARAQAILLAEPKLQLAAPTLGWVTTVVEAVQGFKRPAALAHLRMPTLVLSASEETIVDNDSHEEVARLLPDARHVTIEGAKHEIMMERDAFRAQFWRAFDQLAEQAAPAQRPAGVMG